ncbi:MAG: DUF1330 domain-containing protein [Deltaproteobacteria bacterium]|nr:MAG: DUF1330 domain-containing protein [Deltaproteobacteria bacterium]
MAVYVLAQLTVHDRARYGEYVRRFLPILARFGGRLLAADDAARVLEGSWDRHRVVLLEFASEEAFTAWSSSEAYREIAVDRLAGAEGPILLIHGVAPRP